MSYERALQLKPTNNIKRNIWYPHTSSKPIGKKKLQSKINWNDVLSFTFSEGRVKVCNIRVIDSCLEFNKPLYFGFTIEEGFYCAEYNAGGLIIASAETSKERMIQDMKDQFKHAWYYYALEEDSNLNKGAQNVKKWLRNHMRML